MLVAGGRKHVQPEERVVPGTVVLGRQPETGGVRAGLVSETGRDRARIADERDEFSHRRAEALALVGLMDALARRHHRLAVRQHLGGRRLVRHQGMDLLRVPGHQGKPVDGAAAAAEDVYRPRVQRQDQPVQIVGLLLGRGPQGAVGALAAPCPAGVVGHDRTVGEMPGQGAESHGAHRRPDEQQDRLGTGIVAPDVVVEHGARRVQGVRLRLDHDRPFPGFSSAGADSSCRRNPSICRPVAGPAPYGGAAGDDAGHGGA